jgi:hypothetical protein
MVLLLIVKKAIEKTGVQARTLRRDKLDAFVQTRAHTCTQLHALHAVWNKLHYHLNFLHGEDLSSFSRLFQQGTHDFLKAKIMAGRPGRRAPYLQVRTGPYSYRSLVCFTPHR